MKFLPLAILFAVIIIWASVIQGGGLTEITGGRPTQTTCSGTDCVKPTGFSSPKPSSSTDYRNPTQYTSPPVSIPTPPPPNPVTPNGSSYFSGILVPRNQTITFTEDSSIQGIGNFSIWSTIKDPVDMVAKHSSSGNNGQLGLSSSFSYQSYAPSYSIATKANGTNSTIYVLDAYLPTLMIQQSSLGFVGDSYNERNQYENNGDAIQDYFSSNDIKKDSTYIGGLDRLLQMVNITGSNVIRYPALYNKSTFYFLNTKYIGDYSFDALFNGNNEAGNSVQMSQKYQGLISLNQRMLNVEAFNKSQINDSAMYCLCPEEEASTSSYTPF